MYGPANEVWFFKIKINEKAKNVILQYAFYFM